MHVVIGLALQAAGRSLAPAILQDKISGSNRASEVMQWSSAFQGPELKVISSLIPCLNS